MKNYFKKVRETMKEGSPRNVKLGKLALLVGGSLITGSILYGKMNTDQDSSNYKLPLIPYGSGVALALFGLPYMIFSSYRKDQVDRRKI